MNFGIYYNIVSYYIVFHVMRKLFEYVNLFV